LAATNGDFNVFKLIFNNVDDKNPIDDSKNTPFHFAAENGHISICQLIMATHEDKNPAGGAGTGFGFSSVRTALHIAAANGHLDVYKLIKSRRKNESYISTYINSIRSCNQIQTGT
jgi:ankyrin repeat protein